MVLQPGQGDVCIHGAVEESGMAVSHFLHPVAIQHHHRRRAHPIGRVALGRPPAAVIPHPVVELQGMYLEQIEVHRQRRSEAAIARPAAAELGLDTIQTPAPIPMVVALPEHGAPVHVAFVRPQLPVNVPHASELAGAGLGGALIYVKPRRHSAVYVQIIGLGAVTAVNLGRLGGRQGKDGVGFYGEGLDSCAGVIPG